MNRIYIISVFIFFVRIGFSQIPYQDTINNKWGYSDSTGNCIIKARFESANQFHNNYAIVVQNSKKGLISPTGQFILEPKFEFISIVYNNHVIINEDTCCYKLIDLNGNIFLEFEYIPLSYEFVKEHIFDATYDDDYITKLLISMCDIEVRPDRHKIASECILSASSFNEYIAELLINYILNNKEKIKKDIILFDEFEIEFREGLKTGKWHIE